MFPSVRAIVYNHKLDEGSPVSGQPQNTQMITLEQQIQELTTQLDELKQVNQALQDNAAAKVRQAEEAIATRLLYEQMLSACSQVLLANIEEREEALTETLYEFLVATDVSRVYLCKNYIDESGALYFQQTHEMCALGVPSLLHAPNLQTVHYESELSRWQQMLSRGRHVWSSVESLSDSERQYLELRGVQSILLLPLWVESRWYGFFGFDDLPQPRHWRAEDIQLLQTAVDLIGGYIGRKRAERALRESEEKYRTLIEQSSDAIFLIYGGRFELVNRRFTELFGITQEDVNSSNFVFSNIISPQQARFEELTQQSHQARGHRPPYEFTALNKDGEKIYIELTMSYPLYRHGLATQGIIRDITDRKRIEQEKREAYDKIQEYANELAQRIKEEQRQREITTILAEVVASVSLTLTTAEILEQILRKLQQLVPYDSAAVYLINDGYLVLEAAHGNKSDFVDREISLERNLVFQEMESTKSYKLVTDTRVEGGQEFWIANADAGAWIGAPLLVAQNVIGLLAVHSYVAEAYSQRDAELVQAFAHQVAQTIHNARLFTELKEAQVRLVQRERLAALGQMAATVAHEVRNPLMSLRMGVEYLTFDTADDEGSQRAAALIKSNMERIEYVVENILFVARTPRLTPSHGSLRQLIERELAHWEMKLAQKLIDCHTELASHLPDVYLDLDQIERVLSNLIGNSVDATGPGGELAVSLRGENGWQIITVTDSGTGIPAEDQARMFEPFFTTKSRGTGLGLAIVRQIIDGHGGRISVWSEPGRGTKFTISLPQALKE